MVSTSDKNQKLLIYFPVTSLQVFVTSFFSPFNLHPPQRLSIKDHAESDFFAAVHSLQLSLHGQLQGEFFFTPFINEQDARYAPGCFPPSIG